MRNRPGGKAARPVVVGTAVASPARPTKAVTSPDFSRGLMAAAGGRLVGFLSRILGLGYDGGPVVGPGGRGFHGPRWSFPARWSGFLLVRSGAGWRGRAARR